MQQEPAIEEPARKDPRVKEVLEVACKIEGMARNAGDACGGRRDLARSAARTGSAL